MSIPVQKKLRWLAGIDLCETKEERVGIGKEIVQLHDAIDRQILMETAAGAIGPQGLAKAKAARLESEIDLLRGQLEISRCYCEHLNREGLRSSVPHSRR